jgi:hypothetical protein
MHFTVSCFSCLSSSRYGVRVSIPLVTICFISAGFEATFAPLGR